MCAGAAQDGIDRLAGIVGTRDVDDAGIYACRRNPQQRIPEKVFGAEVQIMATIVASSCVIRSIGDFCFARD